MVVTVHIHFPTVIWSPLLVLISECYNLRPDVFYLLIIFIHCTCFTQVSGDVIQTPETAVMDSILKIQALQSGIRVLLLGGVRPTMWVDQSAAQFHYMPLI